MIGDPESRKRLMKYFPFSLIPFSWGYSPGPGTTSLLPESFKPIKLFDGPELITRKASLKKSPVILNLISIEDKIQKKFSSLIFNRLKPLIKLVFDFRGPQA